MRGFITESLFRNSAFLVINLAISAVCGYGALSLLARLYSVKAVGLSATAFSASALVVFVAQFGVNYSLPRFLPTTAHRAALINTALTTVVLGTLLAAVIFLTLPFADKLFALGGWIFGVVFVVGACLQACESVFGIVLVADRSSSKVARANTIPNIVKLVAPAAVSSLDAFGAYLARVVSDLVGFIVFGLVIARRGHRFRPAFSIAATRDLGRFSLGMYIANLIGGLPLLVLPIIVLTRFGAKQSAYWSIAIAVASLLYQLPAVVAQALLPEVAHRAGERRYLVYRATFLSAALMLPILIIAYVAAPLPLALFGHNYVAHSMTPLRWLIIAGFITMLNYETGAILFIAKKSFMITVVNAIDAVIVLGLASVWASDVKDVAISWVVGDVFNTLLFALFAILALHEVRGRWEALGGPQA